MARRDIKGVVDFAYLEGFAAGDDDVIDEVLALFREQSAIWGAMLDPGHEGWRDAVHTLKGASRGVGAFQLGDACQACEAAGPGGLPSVRDAWTGRWPTLPPTPTGGAPEVAEVAPSEVDSRARRLTRVLLIKSSSLGDVIHCLPAVSDLSRQVPDLELDWVIEDQFSDIARLHPAVARAIPVRLRHWRHHLVDVETWREFGVFRARIAAAPYDRIIDAQGLIRSAMLARLARGVHCGYDRHSVREPPASLFYDRKYPAGVTLHFCTAERMRPAGRMPSRDGLRGAGGALDVRRCARRRPGTNSLTELPRTGLISSACTPRPARTRPGPKRGGSSWRAARRRSGGSRWCCRGAAEG